MVSAQPASTAIWRSSTLGSSAMALMSQRSQRLSGAVTAATPLCSNSAGGVSSGLLIMNTVGLTGGLGKGMVALGHAARDMQVQVLILACVARDELVDDARPFRIAVRIGESDAVQAVLQAPQVFFQAERACANTPGSLHTRRRRK